MHFMFTARHLAADADGIGQRQPFVLGHELEQRRFAQPFEEYRLVMRQHGNADELPFRIQRDQEVQLHTGKSGNRRQVDGLAHIAHQLRPRGVLLIHAMTASPRQNRMMPPSEAPFIVASLPLKPLERVCPISPTSVMTLLSV